MTFLPPAALGAFTFPEPYGTQGIRLTNARDAPNGCVPRGYSYWSTINNHRGRPDLYVFVARIGLDPLILRVHKATGAVTVERELLRWDGAGSVPDEGCYFSDTDPTKLYWLGADWLQALNVETGESTRVFQLDRKYGDDLWQAHSSSDDTVHSATVRRRVDEGEWPKTGCVVYRRGQQRFFGVGHHDECQISKDGRYLIIQKDHNDLIVDLDLNNIRVITNEQGALAHLDAGHRVMIGEDDKTGDNWRMRLWELDSDVTRVLLEGTPPWGDGLGHVAIRGGRWLLSSNATGDLIDGPLSGSGSPRVIAPGMMAVAPGMTSDERYDRQLRACVDPTGEWACWATNLGDPYGRWHLFLARVGDPSTPPTPPPPPPPPPTTQPGGTMELIQFTTPADAHVQLQHDRGDELFESHASTADGRPCQAIPLPEGLPEGHGARMWVTADGWVTVEQRGRLWIKERNGIRLDRPEFIPDDIYLQKASDF